MSIYYYLKGEGHKFPSDDETDVTSKKMQLASSVTNNPDAAASQQEAEDLAKGLELFVVVKIRTVKNSFFSVLNMVYCSDFMFYCKYLIA